MKVGALWLVHFLKESQNSTSVNAVAHEDHTLFFGDVTVACVPHVTYLDLSSDCLGKHKIMLPPSLSLEGLSPPKRKLL